MLVCTSLMGLILVALVTVGPEAVIEAVGGFLDLFPQPHVKVSVTMDGPLAAAPAAPFWHKHRARRV